MFHKYLHESENTNKKGSTNNNWNSNLLPLKKYATLLYLKGAPYETLYLNSLIPSKATIKREVVEHDRMQPGKIYVESVKKMLHEQNIPLSTPIVISEDATRLKDEISYDPKTNQIFGFLPEYDLSIGLPKPEGFDASSPSKIVESLKKFKMAPYLQIIVAKPLKIGL